ncbi:MAG: hypothetical protein AAF613_07120, partial [Pseudomonadota bacterium]
MKRTLSVSVLGMVMGILLSQPAAAARTPSAPSLKPDLVAASEVISTRDANLMREALAAVDRGDWGKVRRIEGQIYDETARDILTWYRARRDVTMPFGQLNDALERLGSWPETATIRANAEERIQLSGLSANERIAWFESHDGAKTGGGGIILADAYRRVGLHDKSLAEIRQVWHGRSLSRELSQRVMANYGGKLTQDDHRKRMDFLLWTRQTSAATRLKPLLTSDWQALSEARIRLILRRRGVDAAIDAVPASLEAHPGLVFDRAYWRRKRGLTQDVPYLLRGIDGEDVPVAGRGRLWSERNLAMRTALKKAQFALAYDLAVSHGLTSGPSFAEAEWAAGWIALRHLSRPERALAHFETLKTGVGTPISLARADYWTGRAKEALNDADGANAAYLEAADYQFTYYGQLAAEKVSSLTIDLSQQVIVTPEDRTIFA